MSRVPGGRGAHPGLANGVPDPQVGNFTPVSARLSITDTGVGSGGYAGDLTPQLFMWRDIDMYTPLEKPNT